MPPNKPSPGVVTGARRQLHRSGGNGIAGRDSRSQHITQERRAARIRAFIAHRRNVPTIPALPRSYGAAR
jgi:hypothetical protein